MKPSSEISSRVSSGRTSLVEIVPAADGSLWFTEFAASQMGNVTTSGVISEVATPTPGSRPQGMAVGPDGRTIWICEYTGRQIGAFRRG